MFISKKLLGAVLAGVIFNSAQLNAMWPSAIHHAGNHSDGSVALIRQVFDDFGMPRDVSEQIVVYMYLTFAEHINMRFIDTGCFLNNIKIDSVVLIESIKKMSTLFDRNLVISVVKMRLKLDNKTGADLLYSLDIQVLNNACLDGDRNVVMDILYAVGDAGLLRLYYRNLNSRTTILHDAVYHYNLELIKTIICALGSRSAELISIANVPAQDTPLHLAASYQNREDILEILLNALGNQAFSVICMKNRQHKTALHLAAEKGYTKKVKKLLDVAAVGGFGQLSIFAAKGGQVTADDLAQKNGHIETARAIWVALQQCRAKEVNRAKENGGGCTLI